MSSAGLAGALDFWQIWEQEGTKGAPVKRVLPGEGVALVGERRQGQESEESRCCRRASWLEAPLETDAYFLAMAGFAWVVRPWGEARAVQTEPTANVRESLRSDGFGRGPWGTAEEASLHEGDPNSCGSSRRRGVYRSSRSFETNRSRLQSRLCTCSY